MNVKFRSDLEKFLFLSFHAPRINVTYSDNETAHRVVEKLRLLHKKIPSQGIVVHGYSVQDYDWLQQTGLPFLICNDGKKDRGAGSAFPEYFKYLNEHYNFGYLLDLNHVYELYAEYPSLAQELVEAMGKKLHHLHLAGVNADETHALVAYSENREIFLQRAEMFKSYPLILEGVINGKVPDSERY